MTGTDELNILLTNDDGINAPGIQALYEALSDVGTVTTVAPATNQSAVGRSLSYGRTAEDTDSNETGLDFSNGRFNCHIPHTNTDIGYAVNGTPCDCVILGVHAFDDRPDLVVSGCNPGANLGTYVLSRSGTASSAMEAAFLGIPAIAVSMNTLGYQGEITKESFQETARFTTNFIREVGVENWHDDIDYFNINTPAPDIELESIEIMEHTPVYEMDASLDQQKFYLRNTLWEQMANDELPDPPGTDRRAIKDGKVSISPLSTPLEPVKNDQITEHLAKMTRV
jgi:5'-nucleotidase